MPESFGARLRQRREEQEIALTAIAEQTKIKQSLLEALERDDVSHWPGGIFRRAFIRAYAQAVNLNPDVVVREFLELYPDPVEIIEPAAAIASTADGAPTTGGPPTRFRFLVGSAIGSLSRLRRGHVGDDLTIGHTSAPSLAPPSDASTSPPVDMSEIELAKEETPAPQPARHQLPPLHVDLLTVARLCTEFAQVDNANDVQPLLEKTARILGANGIVVWIWDPVAAVLRPALTHGYSRQVLSRLLTVSRDADNPTAAAFRSAHSCAIDDGHEVSGALVAPLLTPEGCAGVLAIEVPEGREQERSARAVATIVAAQLSQLIGGTRPAEVQPDPVIVSADENFLMPLVRAIARR